MRGLGAVQACQLSSARVGPHQREGTARRSIGTVSSRPGGGHALLHRFPSNDANGTTTLSRRRAPMPNAPRGGSAAPTITAPRPMMAAPAANAHAMLVFTGAEYTPRPREKRLPWPHRPRAPDLRFQGLSGTEGLGDWGTGDWGLGTGTADCRVES